MDLFDLHCDTIYECYKTTQGIKSNRLAVSVEKGKSLNKWCQVYAIFTPDDLRGNNAVKHYYNLLELFKRECANNSDQVVHCKSKYDIFNAVNSGKRAAILSVEGGAILNGDLAMIDKIATDGVKIITLTWNGDNELASGIYGSGGGLTEFGIGAIKRLQELNILIDVSHLNERGFWQIVELGAEPIVATHSNFKAIHYHARNVTDEQFVAICKSGGLMGFNYYKDFLGPNCFDKIYANIYHALELGGENNIAFGSDFDGCDIEDCLDSIDKTVDLCDYLLQHGLSESTLKKLCFENAFNLFK